MANLGNLIVRGVTRILGDAYANKFIGNLQGNADTATSAIKASTADSATNATSANKASIATAVQDYGTSDYREIKIGYQGSGLSSSTITHAVGFTDGGTKIKDISKDEFRNWLATASGTWPITVSNSSNSVNAEYANFLNVNYGNEFRFGNISSDQENLWFNYLNPDNTQNNVSIYNFGDGKGGTNSTIRAAQFTGNAATATDADKLDGYHKNDILRKTADPTSVISLNDIVASGIDFTSWNYAHSVNVNNQPWGDGASSAACVISFGTYYPFQIYSDYSNTSYLYYRSYYVGNGWKAWRQFAFLDSNVASASKWANARTITLTGSVTGSVSIDGSQNVSLNTTTNHTHTFASLTDKPTTISEYGIVDSIRLMNDSSGLYVGARSNYGENMTGSKYLEWWNSAGWVHHKAGKFSVPGGTSSQFLKADGSLDSTAYLSLSGGTMTGNIEWQTDSHGIYLYRGCGIEKWSGYGPALVAEGDKTDFWIRNGEDRDIRYLILHTGNYTSYTVKKDGTGATGTWGINISGNAATATNAENATNASAVNGVSFTWDGEITSSQWIAAWESGTSIRTMSAYNTFISMCSYLEEGSSDVTDGTMFITSYATDNGFADPNGKNKPYKRKASLLWNYINNKCSSIYATQSWVNSNFYTCSESDSRYIQSETDPVWTAAKGNYYTKTECNNRYIQSETDPIWTADKINYYTKTECNNKFQPKGTYLTEQNLQGYATQEWVRGEEYLYRSGGTMDARAEIGITTKLFIGNSTSPDTCYTKFNCILHGGGDELNPNWIIRDNGYSEFKSSVSANAFYASSDIRLKNVLDDINIDFDKLKLIPKKYYTWKGSDILQLGTIAQDIQKIYPEVVSKNENGYLSVDYSKLSIIALAAIDKLNERIKELECQIKL